MRHERRATATRRKPCKPASRPQPGRRACGKNVLVTGGTSCRVVPAAPAALHISGRRWRCFGTTISRVEDETLLLDRLRAGDAEAFDSLVAMYDGALRRVARTFVKTSSAADEVVQETWLAVIRGLDNFEARSSLRTWIFTILVNRARTYAVRDARAVPFSALEEEDGPAVDPAAFGADGRWKSAPERLESDPERALLSAETRDQLVREIDQLPARQRAVLTLRDVLGLSAVEVSDLLEVSGVNQRVLLHRGRSRIRRALASLVEEVA
jgi:RNA polymerase sigma-70 factor, ECF subfamily